MKKLLVLLPLALLIATACLGNKETLDNDKKIALMGTPLKLEYFKNIPKQAFTYSDSPAFVITDSHELEAAMNDIKNADTPQPWKGAGWNKIKVYYKNAVLELFTNDTKIGTSASGSFYDLGTPNFITLRNH